MNCKHLYCLALSALLSFPGGTATAQARRTLTLAQYTAGTKDYLAPQLLSSLQWLGNDLIYQREDALIVQNAQGSEHPLLTLTDLRALLPEAKGLEEATKFPRFAVINSSTPLLSLRLSETNYLIEPKAKTIVARWSARATDAATRLSPTNRYVALVRDNNLVVHSLRSREADRLVTSDGSPSIIYGQSVHQNEFGIDGGLFWSPDGTKLAFYRMDQSMVTPYPILHVDARRPYKEDQYYPMAGTPSHEVTLGVYDLETGETTYLATGLPKDKYLTNVSWSPDGRELYIAEVNRAQTECHLRAYSPRTGQVLSTLFSERNDIYTEPLHGMRFLPSDPTKFIWQSRRDGYNHLYLYSTSGQLIRQLTRGAWEVTDLLGTSQSGRELYYMSTEASPLERQAYRLDLKSGKRTRLTKAAGFHQARLSADARYLLDSYSSTETAGRQELIATSGRGGRLVCAANNPDLEHAMPQIELGTILAADDRTPLHYRLIKPHDFSPEKKYPTIIYVYNGPHAQLVQNRHRAAARGWELYMANLGYIIFTVDGRGSAYRGSAFEQVIHRRLGQHEMADQMRGVAYLKSQPWVDDSRIGVYGWSYGGFMTTNLMLTHPETFKVGVAGGPVMDWARYEIMYGERYMDTPEDNPEGYKQANLIERAGDLRGRLLVIHGTIDPVVIWQHSLLFVQAAVKAGTHPDYMVYPEHPHNVIGADREHLNFIISRYFQDHL